MPTTKALGEHLHPEPHAFNAERCKQAVILYQFKSLVEASGIGFELPPNCHIPFPNSLTVPHEIPDL